jgi:transcription antitermination protein NusB
VSKPATKGKRGRARELLVQALYQMQITGHDLRELRSQFSQRPEYERVDQAYFDAALAAICNGIDEIETAIDEFADRPIEQLDPVERGILLLGCYELQSVTDVPYKVVINEAVNLARRFGAEDGYKYINALLDRASKKLRPAEHR